VFCMLCLGFEFDVWCFVARAWIACHTFSREDTESKTCIIEFSLHTTLPERQEGTDAELRERDREREEDGERERERGGERKDRERKFLQRTQRGQRGETQRGHRETRRETESGVTEMR